MTKLFASIFVREIPDWLHKADADRLGHTFAKGMLGENYDWSSLQDSQYPIEISMSMEIKSPTLVVKEDNDLRVAVSGSTVYRAVSNYVKNSPEMQQVIKEKVAAVFNTETIKQAILQQLGKDVSYHFSNEKIVRDGINKVIKTEVTNLIKIHLTETKLKNIVKDNLVSMLIKE